MTTAELHEAGRDLIWRLAQIRQEQGMSQKQVARAIGISASSISLFESYRRAPGLEIVLRYAAAVGAEVVVQ